MGAQDEVDARLEFETILERYRSIRRYRITDDWHEYTAARIRHELRVHWWRMHVHTNAVVLNAGAGNNDLGVCPPSTINLDTSEAGVALLPNPIVASIEDIPLPNASVDTLVCVGSVINYCDAAAAISEFSRILKPGGHLVLEYESSRAADLFKQTAFGRAAAIAETFYGDEPEVLWVFDPRYIRSLLSASGLKVVKTIPIHIGSPWALLVTKDIRRAAAMAPLDRVLRFVPVVARWASNQLMFCRKMPS
jgi:SAM-dependent methyltransferase